MWLLLKNHESDSALIWATLSFENSISWSVTKKYGGIANSSQSWFIFTIYTIIKFSVDAR